MKKIFVLLACSSILCFAASVGTASEREGPPTIEQPAKVFSIESQVFTLQAYELTAPAAILVAADQSHRKEVKVTVNAGWTSTRWSYPLDLETVRQWPPSPDIPAYSLNKRSNQNYPPGYIRRC